MIAVSYGGPDKPVPKHNGADAEVHRRRWLSEVFPDLTRKQAELFLWFVDYCEENGFPPTFREAADSMGHSARSTGYAQVRRLVEAGYLKKSSASSAARSYLPTGKGIDEAQRSALRRERQATAIAVAVADMATTQRFFGTRAELVSSLKALVLSILNPSGDQEASA